MAKDINNSVQDEEIQDEAMAEAEANLDPNISEEENNDPDEVAEDSAAIEASMGADMVMPAEIAAINTDNSTTREANSEKNYSKSNIKESSQDDKKGHNMANEKFDKLITEIENLTTLELSELVKTLEEKFGVSASAPMMAAAPAAGAAVEAEEEKSSYTLVLADAGAQKIAVIKALREINQELGLKEAKDLADGAPKEIKKDMPKADAEEAKKKLEAAGAKVELK
jgi:large subunit ribosomal protein L7/L12